jgi:hypothetical protein
MSGHANFYVWDLPSLHDYARMVGRTPEDALNAILEAELARKEKQLAAFLQDEEDAREAFAKQRHAAFVEAKASGRVH